MSVPPKWNPSSSKQSTITSFVKNTKTSTITRPVNSVINGVLKRPTVTGNLVNVKGFKDLNTETDLPATTRPNAFSGAGFSLGGNVAKEDRSNCLTNTTENVRNHWANKFPSSAKKRVPDIPDSGSNKRRKINNNTEINVSSSNNLNSRNTSSHLIDSIYLSDSEDDIAVSLENKSITSNVEEIFKPGLVNCPICTKLTPEISINEHLDECMGNLLMDEEQDVQIIETRKDVIVIDDDDELVTEFNGDDSLIEDFMNKSSSDSTKSIKEPVIDSNQNTTLDDLLNCPLCNVEMSRRDLADHFDSCISDDFTTTYVNKETSLADQTSETLKAAGYTDQEIQECVKNIKLENATSSSSYPVIKDLKKSIKDLDNSYFNESVNASFVGSQTVELEDDDESYLGDLTQDDVPNSFACPKCSILIKLEEMNCHLDKCLNS